MNELKTGADEEAEWVGGCGTESLWKSSECFSFSLHWVARSTAENMDGGRTY